MSTNSAVNGREVSFVEAGFISYTDISRLMGELADGESLVITADGNKYQFYKGNSNAIKWDKLKNLAMKVVRHIRGNWDDKLIKEIPLPKLHKVVVTGESMQIENAETAWQTLLKIWENHTPMHPLADLFCEYIKEHSSDEKFVKGIRVNIITGGRMDWYYEISLPDYPVILVVNRWGSARQTIYKGVREDLN